MEEELKKLLRERGYSNRVIREIEKLYSEGSVTKRIPRSLEKAYAKIPVPMFSTPIEVLEKYYGEIPEEIKKIVERGSGEVQTEA